MTIRLAARTDAANMIGLCTLVYAEPDFDLYPRKPMAVNQYRVSADDEQWGVWANTAGAVQGLIWTAPSLKDKPQEMFEVLAFYTDPRLVDTERRRIGLEMIVWEAKRRIAAGWKYCQFELPVNNVKVRGFAAWVEPTPKSETVSGTDPLTGAPLYYHVVWELAVILPKAEKLLSV